MISDRERQAQEQARKRQHSLKNQVIVPDYVTAINKRIAILESKMDKFISEIRGDDY